MNPLIVAGGAFAAVGLTSSLLNANANAKMLSAQKAAAEEANRQKMELDVHNRIILGKEQDTQVDAGRSAMMENGLSLSGGSAALMDLMNWVGAEGNKKMQLLQQEIENKAAKAEINNLAMQQKNTQKLMPFNVLSSTLGGFAAGAQLASDLGTKSTTSEATKEG